MPKDAEIFSLLWHIMFKSSPQWNKTELKENKIMNRIRNIQKFILTALLVTMLVLVSSAPAMAAAPSAGWLSLTSTVSGCTWTVNVTWTGFKGAKTLEAYVTQTYTGAPLVPTFVPVNSKSGIATVTLTPLAPSATLNNFYAWAQLLDAHGNPIPGSLDFASVSSAYCTAP
jgi:hypothetical protein